MTPDQIVAALVKPLGPWTEGRHYGVSGRTLEAVCIFGKVEVTTGWENGKASAHRTHTETTWHDDEAAAIAFLEADRRARIAAAFDADKMVALVGAATNAVGTYRHHGWFSDGQMDDLHAALAAFRTPDGGNHD